MVVDGLSPLEKSSGIASAYARLAELLATARHDLDVVVGHTGRHSDSDFRAAATHFLERNVTLVRLVPRALAQQPSPSPLPPPTPLFLTHSSFVLRMNPLPMSSVPDAPMEVYANYYQEQSYRAYLWLRDLHCDVIHFHALGGSGYYTALAKHQGLLPYQPTVVVGVHATADSRMRAINRGPVDPASPTEDHTSLVSDFMQRRSAELAVGLSLLVTLVVVFVGKVDNVPTAHPCVIFRFALARIEQRFRHIGFWPRYEVEDGRYPGRRPLFFRMCCSMARQESARRGQMLPILLTKLCFSVGCPP